MADETLNRLVEQAVGQSFALWAVEHPSLAAVIDRLELTTQTAESLRAAPAYRQAVEDYYRDRNEQGLLNQLAQFAGPILLGILAG